MFVGDDLEDGDQPEPLVFGCEGELHTCRKALGVSDAGIQLECASSDAKADSAHGSLCHWFIELNQKPFDADVSRVPEQHGRANQEFDREAEVNPRDAIGKGLNHDENILAQYTCSRKGEGYTFRVMRNVGLEAVSRLAERHGVLRLPKPVAEFLHRGWN